jgi:hypothetical protein
MGKGIEGVAERERERGKEGQKWVNASLFGV